MEHYFLRHEDWLKWYNCSLIDVDSVPFQSRRAHPIASIVTLVLTTIYYSLYIPCMFSLWKQQKDGNSFYRLLFYAGICDCGILWSLGYITGIMGLQGAVYCTHPLLLYFTATIHDAFFASELLCNLVLAVNRCLDILVPALAHCLFEGRMIWFWLVGMILYGLYWLLFVQPAVFSSIYFAYFFNPFMGYINDAETNDKYNPLIHKINDWTLCYSLFVVYLAFLIGLKWKMWRTVGGFGINRLQVMIFLQVFVVSFLHVFGAFMYVFMQKFELGHDWTVVGQFSWYHIHGLPPVFFIIINPSVRSDCIMMFHRIFNRNRISHLHGVTVMAPKSGLTSAFPTAVVNADVNVRMGGSLPPTRGAVQPHRNE